MLTSANHESNERTSYTDNKTLKPQTHPELYTPSIKTLGYRANGAGRALRISLVQREGRYRGFALGGSRWWGGGILP